MQTPPPFAPPEMQRPKSNTGLIIAIVFGVLGVCCVLPGIAMVVFGVNFWKKAAGPANCAIGFEEVRLAINEYTRDHDGKLPDAENWMDEVRPYFTSIHNKAEERGPFQGIEPTGDWGCRDDSTGQVTGMAYNIELSGKKLSDVQNPRTTPLIFEIDRPAKNAAEKYRERPDSTGPLVFGQHRPWFVMYVKERNDNIQFRVNGQPSTKGEGSSADTPDPSDN